MAKRKVKQPAHEQLKNDIQGKNYKLLKQHLFEYGITSISKYNDLIPDLLREFDQDYLKQYDSIKLILDKIALVPNPEEFHMMEAQYSSTLATVIINLNINELREQIKHSNFKIALQLLERTNHIMNMESTKQLRKSKQTTEQLCINLEKEVEEGVSLLLSKSASIENTYELAKFSVEYRSQNLPTTHHSTIKALIEAARIGYKIGDIAVQIEALNFAEEAYNISMHTKNAKCASDAKLIAAEFFEQFGNATKSAVMKHQAQSEVADINSTAIISHGKFDRDSYNVQKILQPTLDAISKLANTSLWFHSIGINEFGVSGYVSDEYLTQILGDLFSPTSLKIAKMLSFEAINLGLVKHGIDNEVKPNLICTMIFAAKNPELIGDIAQLHPEYFVNWNIVKVTLPAASAASAKLIGQDVALDSQYNLFVEEAMSPVIEARLAKVIGNVKTTVGGGQWSTKIEKALIKTFSPEYLTGPGVVYPSILGRNLGAIKDNVEVAQVLLFKAMLDVLQSSGSKNYAPIDSITKAYPQLVGRVFVSHKPWVTDKEVLRLFDSPELLQPKASPLELPLSSATGEAAVETLGDGGTESKNDE